MHHSPQPHLWKRWTVVLVVVSLVTAIRFSLNPFIEGQVPLLLYVLAVLVSAAFGGFWSGITAGATSLLIAVYLFMEPIHSLAITDLADGMRVLSFAVVSVWVSWACSAMRAATQRAEESAREASLRRDQLENEVLERERASAALQQSETDFRALFELAAVGMAQADPATGRLRRVNRTLCELLGYSEQEMLRMCFPDFTHPEDRERDFTAFQHEVHGEGAFYRSEKRYVRKDGKILWAVVNARIVRDSEGKPRDSFAAILNITERKEAEQILQDQETQLRQIGDNLPDGFLYQVVAEPTGERRFVHFSAGVEQITGVPAEAALQDATKLYSLIHPKDAVRLQAEEERCLKEGCSYQVFARLRHAKSGKWFWALMRSAKRTTSTGQTVWDGVCLDVTEAQETKEALQRSNERLELAQHAGRTGVFDWNVQSGEVVWNEEELRIFGLVSFEGTIGDAFKGIHPEDADRMRREIFEMMGRRASGLNLAFRVVLPLGQIRWVEGAARFVYQEDGTPLRMVGVNIDVTERHEAQLRLKESEAKLRTVVLSASASGIGIGRSHADGRILEANDALLAMLGYTQDDLMTGRMNWQTLTPREYVDRDNQVAAEIAEGKPLKAYEKEYYRKDGSRIPVLLSGNFAPGTTDEFICFLLDLTEQKRTERELTAAKDAAETASKAKDHFLAVLSHELRTPLAPVVPLLGELIERAGLSDHVQEDLRTIQRNILLEARLIDDLLDLTRILRGKMELRMEKVDLHALLEQSRAICCTDEVREQGVQVELEGAATHHHVYADPTRLKQVFWNLIGNACKFSSPGAIVTVRTRDAGEGTLWVEVIDQGVGISAELRSRLFQPFEQGNRYFGNERRGLGLGLAISKSLVEAHGGEIEAGSEGVGKGATFRVSLPVVRAADAHGESTIEDACDDRRPEEAAEPIKRILLVEDHADTARVMKRLLTSRGFTVELASSREEAINVGQARSFDLLISDLGLPDGTGFEVMVELGKRGITRGIALSGFGTDADIEKSKKAGFFAHFVKPVDFENLLEVIKKRALP